MQVWSQSLTSKVNRKSQKPSLNLSSRIFFVYMYVVWCLVWYGYGYINQWDTSKQKVMKTMQKDSLCVKELLQKELEGGHDAPPQTFLG